jgi:hypothetical protein
MVARGYPKDFAERTFKQIEGGFSLRRISSQISAASMVWSSVMPCLRLEYDANLAIRRHPVGTRSENMRGAKRYVAPFEAGRGQHDVLLSYRLMIVGARCDQPGRSGGARG